MRGVVLAPYQVIDAFLHIEDGDLELMDSWSHEEIMTFSEACAKELGLRGDGIGNYFPKEGVVYRNFSGGCDHEL